MDARSTAQIESLKQQVGDNIDLDWAFVGKLKVTNKDKVIAAIK